MGRARDTGQAQAKDAKMATVLTVEEANVTMTQIFDVLFRCRRLVAAAALTLIASLPATAVRAQQVVVIVNGDPITALDIEQRSKLTQLSTHKAPPRQEVLE